MTPRARCNRVISLQFKSRFGSKLQYFGTSIIVPNAVRFTVSFSSNQPVHITALNVAGGTVNFSNGQPVNTSTLTLLNGTVMGLNTIVVNGLMTWSMAVILEPAGTR